MKENKKPNFFLLIIGMIIGRALYKQLDFESVTFKKPALAFVYIIVLVVSVYLFLKKEKKQTNK